MKKKKNEHAVILGRQGGLARMAKMAEEDRKRVARLGGQAAQAKKKQSR